MFKTKVFVCKGANQKSSGTHASPAKDVKKSKKITPLISGTIFKIQTNNGFAPLQALDSQGPVPSQQSNIVKITKPKVCKQVASVRTSHCRLNENQTDTTPNMGTLPKAKNDTNIDSCDKYTLGLTSIGKKCDKLKRANSSLNNSLFLQQNRQFYGFIPLSGVPKPKGTPNCLNFSDMYFPYLLMKIIH